MASTINICFCTDENLLEHIPVVVNSILNKNSHHQINIHLLHNIEDRKKIGKLRKYLSQFKNLSFTDYHKTWNRTYNGLKHVTAATMLRLYIPELISDPKLLYLDIDLIVNLDLMEIYQLDCGETGIALKTSIKPIGRRKRGCSQTIMRFSNGKKSGNCGVIMMNLNDLRKNNFTNECLKIHDKHPSQHDQFIINTFCQGNHTKLEGRFNIFANQDDHLAETAVDFIYHYAGSKKPYLEDVGKYQHLWDSNK